MPDDHVDVLIVGAGLSGIGAAHHVTARCPWATYTILEARDAIGGTWDLFRYPGVRSDSDMYTLGYSFRPWTDPEAIADGPAILRYVRQTAADDGSDRHIRFGHRAVRAEWSEEEARWTVEARRTDTGETASITCGFLLLCTGYYRYDRGYEPELPGVERFRGPVVHPQRWPEDLEWAGKRVVVIGSGATAVTLVPAMARDAAHVTMLQRSPSYVLSLPGRDPLARLLRGRIPDRAAYAIVRWKNVVVGQLFYVLSRRRPRFVKGLLRRGAARRLPAGFDVDTHFRPRYDPWDQRLCFVPDGDLFEALSDGRASILTDRISTFTERGVRLESGDELDADVIVAATGLDLLALGGIELAVDGEEVRIPERLTYKGLMLSDVPNLAYMVGYTNASWTLKSDLTAEHACRLIDHLHRHGLRSATPRVRGASIRPEPIIDFSSGYVRRGIGRFPKQGQRSPWRLHQNYLLDVMGLRYGRVDDDALELAGASGTRPDTRVPAPGAESIAS